VKGPVLQDLGWTPSLAEAWGSLAAEGLVPGRVIAVHTRLLRVRGEAGEWLAEVTGRLRHEARGPEERPAVGDWVALRPRDGEARGLIQAVLPRRTAFVRRAAGDQAVAQVLAANIDTVFLVAGLDGDFNLRRIERILVLAWESGAEPVILLNKADVCPEAETRRLEVEGVAPGVPVHVIAAKTGRGLEVLAPYLRRGQTVALLGSSGVGKSTLVNRLLGVEKQKTREVRAADQRGRHTTTHRELVPLPGGGLLVDSPGLREIQLWVGGEGLQVTFEDVETLAPSCRFRDCTHDGEPGCAVVAAVEAGALAAERFESFRKLRAELRALEVRDDPRLRREEKARWRSIHKTMRNFKPRE
jgi:ribosome biogenesis GTPase